MSESASIQGSSFVESDDEYFMEDSDASYYQDNRSQSACQLCGKKENEQQTLLCDGCDGEFHMYCLEPPLTRVPKGSWYCDACKKSNHREKPTEKKPRDTDFVDKVKTAVESLGVATGDTIVDKLQEIAFQEMDPKALKHRVNAVLSSKSYANLFEKLPKSKTLYKRSLWRLKGSDAKIPFFYPSDMMESHVNIRDDDLGSSDNNNNNRSNRSSRYQKRRFETFDQGTLPISRSRQRREIQFLRIVKRAVFTLGTPSTAVEIAQQMLDNGYRFNGELGTLKQRVWNVLVSPANEKYFVRAERLAHGRTVVTWSTTHSSLEEIDREEVEELERASNEERDSSHDVPTMPLQRGEGNESDLPRKCKICNTEAVVHATHPNIMTGFYHKTMGFLGELKKDDWLCRSCYGYWYRENRDLPSEDGGSVQEKRGPGRPRKSKWNLGQDYGGNSDVEISCEYCGKSDEDSLVFCQNCNRSVHQRCLPRALSEEERDHWLCHECYHIPAALANTSGKLRVRVGYVTEPDGNEVFHIVGKRGRPKKQRV